jgi:hypothetical protein
MVVLVFYSDLHRDTRVDLFLTEPCRSTRSTSTRSSRSAPGLPVRSLRREALIRLKREAGRPQDLAGQCSRGVWYLLKTGNRYCPPALEQQVAQPPAGERWPGVLLNLPEDERCRTPPRLHMIACGTHRPLFLEESCRTHL